MARKNARRDDADMARVREIQELRRSNAATAVRNKTRYSRVDAKRAVARGEW
jgi:hypothetical protein